MVTKKRDIRELPLIEPFINEQEKNPEVKVLMDRAQLKMEIAYAGKRASEQAE